MKKWLGAVCVVAVLVGVLGIAWPSICGWLDPNGDLYHTLGCGAGQP